MSMSVWSLTKPGEWTSSYWESPRKSQPISCLPLQSQFQVIPPQIKEKWIQVDREGKEIPSKRILWTEVIVGIDLSPDNPDQLLNTSALVQDVSKLLMYTFCCAKSGYGNSHRGTAASVLGLSRICTEYSWWWCMWAALSSPHSGTCWGTRSDSHNHQLSQFWFAEVLAERSET